MILHILADNKRFYWFSLLIGYNGECVGNGISAQCQPAGCSDAAVLDHIENNRTDQIHSLRIKSRWLTVKVIIALSSRSQRERRIFAVFERPLQYDFSESFLQFVNTHYVNSSNILKRKYIFIIIIFLLIFLQLLRPPHRLLQKPRQWMRRKLQ